MLNKLDRTGLVLAVLFLTFPLLFAHQVIRVRNAPKPARVDFHYNTPPKIFAHRTNKTEDEILNLRDRIDQSLLTDRNLKKTYDDWEAGK
jgi:hypothetical protein